MRFTQVALVSVLAFTAWAAPAPVAAKVADVAQGSLTFEEIPTETGVVYVHTGPFPEHEETLVPDNVDETSPNVALTQNMFTSTCDACNLVETLMCCSCRLPGESGRRRSACIELNERLVNNDGVPQYGGAHTSGGFAHSCRDLGVQQNKWLFYYCKKTNGKWNPSSPIANRFDLNSCISNINGYLRWNDY